MTSYPISSATMEPHYVGACEQFAHLIGRLKHPDARKLTHGAVEALIHTEGMELVRRLNPVVVKEDVALFRLLFV